MLPEQLTTLLKIQPPIPENTPIAASQDWDPEALIRTAEAAGLPPEPARAMRKEICNLLAIPGLGQYFNTVTSIFFGPDLDPFGTAPWLPLEIGVLSEKQQYIFFALLTFYAFPSRRAAFAAAGFPEDAADNAVKDVFVWMEHFYRNLQYPGLSPRILSWDVPVLNGYPLTLGRMQYILKPFHDPLHVYRNTRTGEVLALAGDGSLFDRNGLANAEDAPEDPQSWRATLSVTADAVTGNPVYPCGRADQKTVTLDPAVWKLQFKQGDWTLDTHIPEGPDLKPEDCRDSMIRALAFFRERHPDKEIKSFSCLSWLLDPQYDRILKPESRILAWMHQYYLFPIPESGADALWRIFGENGMKDGLANAPRQTSMQRNVASFLEQGGKLRSGGGFILPEDLADYGKKPYLYIRK